MAVKSTNRSRNDSDSPLRLPHNPEVAGSNPVPATIKTTDFERNRWFFFTFEARKIRPKMRRGPRGDYEGQKGRQNHHVRCSDALSVFGSFPAEIHLRQRVARLLLALFDHMAVDILRSGNLGMAQHLGDRDHIRSLRDQHRGCRVSKPRKGFPSDTHQQSMSIRKNLPIFGCPDRMNVPAGRKFSTTVCLGRNCLSISSPAVMVIRSF